MRLGVDGAAGPDEGRDVGDRVPEPEPAGGTGLEVQRLVEVHRARRVDRHERHVGEIRIGQTWIGGRRGGLLEHVRQERLGDLQLGAELGEHRAQLVARDREPDRSSRHDREDRGVEVLGVLGVTIAC